MWTLLYKSFLIFCGLVLSLVLAGVLIIVAVMFVHREQEGQVLIDPSELAKIQVGDVVRLSQLLKEPAETVCFLTPYRDRLDETEALSDRVNTHLDAMRLRLSGSVFALVFVNGDKVSVQRLSDRRLYIAAWHEGAGRIAKRLGCASANRVLVTKVTDPLWPTLIFGEER
jgi:hypothetical protein